VTTTAERGLTVLAREFGLTVKVTEGLTENGKTVSVMLTAPRDPRRPGGVLRWHSWTCRYHGAGGREVPAAHVRAYLETYTAHPEAYPEDLYVYLARALARAGVLST
jgi:hypothetical protein